MIPRHITAEFQTQLREYPIVTVIGPRQAGKTTLVRAALPDYVSLENPESRQLAMEDPKAFLKQHPVSGNFSPLARSFVVYSGEPISFSDGIEAINYYRTADIF
jgi:hypothetical protein